MTNLMGCTNTIEFNTVKLFSIIRQNLLRGREIGEKSIQSLNIGGWRKRTESRHTWPLTLLIHQGQVMNNTKLEMSLETI